MKKRQATPLAIHNGKLHWASLLSVLPKTLYLPGKRTIEDPFCLGCQLDDSIGNVGLHFNGMTYATAEAVVGLAAIAERLRSNRSAESCRIDFDDRSRAWVEALRLDQIADR